MLTPSSSVQVAINQFINLFIKINNTNVRFELPTEVIKEYHILWYDFM